jgi:PEP-CTERM motif
MSKRLVTIGVITAILVLDTASAYAQSIQVSPNGTLTDSTAGNTVTNLLNTGSTTAGFNFSGTTGSFDITAPGGNFSTASGSSANGYYYADYLISVTGSSAESVTTSLQNSSGVSSLSERIYTYNPTAGLNGFLGDESFAAAGIQGIQAWSTDYPLAGTNVSIISPTNITAGEYVIELRGTTGGNFGGTLSIAPVPEPEFYMMMLAGLSLLFAYRRKNRK